MGVRALRIATKDQTTYIDLLSQSNFLLAGSWRTTHRQSEGVITETFDIVFSGTNDQIRQNVEALSKMVQRVQQWREDPLSDTSVWWEETSEGEVADTKRSLITELDFSPSPTGRLTKLLSAGALVVSVVVTHLDVYEKTAGFGYGGSGLSTLGGKILTESTSASAPGRVYYLILSSEGSYTLTDVWIGSKPLYEQVGNDVYSNLNPKQETEAGTANIGSFIADATASGGSTWQVTSVPSSLSAAADWYKELDETSRPYARGRYLVLARVKVNSGVVGIEMSYGEDSHTAAPVNIYRNEMRYISNTSWKLVELGTYRYPFHDRAFTGVPPLGWMSLRVMQVSGTTTDLRVDCIVLIPNDYFIKGTNCNATANVLGGGHTKLVQMEDGVPIAVNYAVDLPQNRIIGAPQLSYSEDLFPWDGGVMVVAAQRSTEHVLSDLISITMIRYDRYKAYTL